MAAERQPGSLGINPSDVLQTSCGCHLHLKGIRRGDGYANVKRRGKMLGAHRVAWAQVNGPIPEGLMVCHRCDVRCCVNPEHLFLGTAQDNAIDRQEKGRSAPASDAFRRSGLGVRRSEKTRSLLAAANRLRVVSAETKKKHSENAKRQWAAKKERNKETP